MYKFHLNFHIINAKIVFNKTQKRKQKILSNLVNFLTKSRNIFTDNFFEWEGGQILVKMYLILKLLSFFFSTDATRVKRNPLSTVLRIIFAPIFFYFFCTGITKTFEIHENGISIGWKKENTQQQVSFLS